MCIRDRLYPKKLDFDDSELPLISTLLMLDLGKTEDLFMYAPNIPGNTEYGLNYIRDWYGTQTLGMNWTKFECASGQPCFAKNNKEVHIGFGASWEDAFPQWMGYTNHNQFGKKVSGSVIIEPAALFAPDHNNATFALDKIIRIETGFKGKYEIDNTGLYARRFTRPHIDNGKQDTDEDGLAYGTSGDFEDIRRYHEDIGADYWLYGLKRGLPYIYKIKMENPNGVDAMRNHASVDTDTQCRNMKEGDMIRSNILIDSQGQDIPINSICASMRYKNCVWALSLIHI